MELWELQARELIRDTIARYAHCADTGRFAELVGLFTEDGVLEIEGRAPYAGRAAIQEFLTGTKTNLASNLTRPLIRHHVSSIRVDLLSHHDASAVSYFLVITERGPDHWGRYRDHLSRVGDRWLLRHRRVHPEGHGATSWVATRRESP